MCTYFLSESSIYLSLRRSVNFVSFGKIEGKGNSIRNTDHTRRRVFGIRARRVKRPDVVRVVIRPEKGVHAQRVHVVASTVTLDLLLCAAKGVSIFLHSSLASISTLVLPQINHIRT